MVRMVQIPTRKRRNNKRRTYRQRGGDETDNLIQSLLEEAKTTSWAKLDQIFDDIDEGFVERILAKKDVDPTVFQTLLDRMLLNSVMNDSISITKRLLADDRVNPMADENKAFLYAIQNEKVEMVKLFLESSRFDPGAYDNKAIQVAAAEIPDVKSAEIVKLLLAHPKVDPGANDNEALRSALEYSASMQILSLLLADPRVDITIDDNVIITRAIVGEKEYYETNDFPDTQLLSALLQHPQFDPMADYNLALRLACDFGNEKAAEMLLSDSRVDPSVENNAPLLSASEENHDSIVLLLLQDPRVDPSVGDNSPVQYAAMNRNKGLIDVLLRYPAVSANKNIFRFACEGKYTPGINEFIISKFPEESCTPEEPIEEITQKYDPSIVSYNFIEISEIPLITELSMRDTIVIKATNSYFTLSRSDIEKNFKTNENTRFECLREMIAGSFIYEKDVVVNVPYYYIQGVGNFLVRKAQLLAAMNKYSIIEMIKTEKKIQSLATYGVVQRESGLRLDGNPLEEGSYVSADHCQAGSQQNVYEIRGIVLQP